MKELSTEEKAQRYDDALERYKAKQEYECQRVHEFIEYLFPELKESEDERIRNEIILYIGAKDDISLDTHNKWLSWLEKQGNPQVRTGLEWVNTIDNACDERYAEEYSHGEYCHEQSFKWGFQEGVEWLEKQGEQKPADKVEPKFHIGDIIFNKKTKEQFTITDMSLALQYYHDEDHLHEVRFSEQDDWEIIKPKFQKGDWVFVEEVDGHKQGPFQIKEITQYGYTFFDERRVMPFECESLMTLWSIDDAKDGDILVASDDSIFIYAGIAGEYAKCYVALTKYGEFNLESGPWEVKTRVHPATKEQRNTFFIKIKETNIKEHS